MTPDFDSRLRESLDAAPARDLLPGFDKTTLWPQIAACAKRSAALRIALPWLSHAAAVAAGLLLAWLALPVQEGKDSRNAIVVHAPAVEATSGAARATPTAPVPSVSAAGNTVVVSCRPAGDKPVRTAENRAQLAYPPRVGATALDAQPTVALAPVADSAARVPSVFVRAQEPQKKSAVPKQPAPLVVHLMDVAGEGERRLRAPVEPLARRGRSLFSRLLSRAKVPDVTGTAADDAVVVRPILSR